MIFLELKYKKLKRETKLFFKELMNLKNYLSKLQKPIIEKSRYAISIKDKIFIV
jgi:hypothetical protein